MAGVLNGFSQASSRIDSPACDIAEDLFAPGLLEKSSCKSGFWSAVETRA